jgi:hypothetical protein
MHMCVPVGGDSHAHEAKLGGLEKTCIFGNFC